MKIILNASELEDLIKDKIKGVRSIKFSPKKLEATIDILGYSSDLLFKETKPVVKTTKPKIASDKQKIALERAERANIAQNKRAGRNTMSKAGEDRKIAHIG